MRELYSSPQISIKGHLSMDPDVRVCVCAAAFYVMYCDSTFFLDTSSVSSPVYAYMGVCVCQLSVYSVCRLHKHSMLHFFRVSHVCLFSTCRFPSSRTWFSVWKEHIGYLTLACGREAASTIMAALNCIPGQ